MVCKVHGFAVAGGSDVALCADLVVMAETATIGYMPARVWGSPTTAMWVYRLGPERAKRMLFTGDTITGRSTSRGERGERRGAAGSPSRLFHLSARSVRATLACGRRSGAEDALGATSVTASNASLPTRARRRHETGRRPLREEQV